MHFIYSHKYNTKFGRRFIWYELNIILTILLVYVIAVARARTPIAWVRVHHAILPGTHVIYIKKFSYFEFKICTYADLKCKIKSNNNEILKGVSYSTECPKIVCFHAVCWIPRKLWKIKNAMLYINYACRI